MFTSRYRICAAIAVALGFIALLASLLLPEPKIAWNAGARESLRKALHKIKMELVVTDDVNSEHKLDPRDFIPRSIEDGVEHTAREAKLLAEKNGVLVKWYLHGDYQDILFYPITISNEIVIAPNSTAKPTPQVVMVPIEQMDIETLPNLHGCRNATAEKIQECQLRRIKELLSKHGINYPITLMSDGSVFAVAIHTLEGDLSDIRALEFGITEEFIARQPPEAQAIIRLLLAKITELDLQIEELQRHRE